jgi:hypothetical protein
MRAEAITPPRQGEPENWGALAGNDNIFFPSVTRDARQRDPGATSGMDCNGVVPALRVRRPLGRDDMWEISRERSSARTTWVPFPRIAQRDARRK